MPVFRQPIHQRGTYQAIRAHDQHAPTVRWRQVLRSALVSGAIASACSTLLVSWLSHRRTGALPAGTNATSHWVHGHRATRRDGWSLRHTLVGYLIHHASSLLWATGYERMRQAGSTAPSRVLALAGGTAALACLVDYKVVPSRLTPGFEHRLPRRDLALIYMGFAVGLALPCLLRSLRR